VGYASVAQQAKPHPMKTILPVALAVLRPVTLAKITLLPVKAAKRTTTLVKTFALPALQVHINNLKIP